MFYSQFILAKKGPLGTIWIAAHLERKLRKNQVADTDIGVSVDSILFPDAPIALRLSSHLLLGVVRIYSKKVNYLFNDCSEALIKIKHAFRSTAVDLPPEESTAPYHSITLPENFDLDNFELPDSAFLDSNFVDHHVSAREQITLQDTVNETAFPTSKFGLDERFGDEDASPIGLELDEELFMDNNVSAQRDEVSMNSKDSGLHHGETSVPSTSMALNVQFGRREEKYNEITNELSELLSNNYDKDGFSGMEELRRDINSSHRHGYTIQTPDLNEIFQPECSTALSSHIPFTPYDFQTPCLVERAQEPSTPALLEVVPSHLQEVPALSPQEKAEICVESGKAGNLSTYMEIECSESGYKTIHAGAKLDHKSGETAQEPPISSALISPMSESLTPTYSSCNLTTDNVSLVLGAECQRSVSTGNELNDTSIATERLDNDESLNPSEFSHEAIIPTCSPKLATGFEAEPATSNICTDNMNVSGESLDMTRTKLKGSSTEPTKNANLGHLEDGQSTSVVGSDFLSRSCGSNLHLPSSPFMQTSCFVAGPATSNIHTNSMEVSGKILGTKGTLIKCGNEQTKVDNLSRLEDSHSCIGTSVVGSDSLSRTSGSNLHLPMQTAPLEAEPATSSISTVNMDVSGDILDVKGAQLKGDKEPTEITNLGHLEDGYSYLSTSVVGSDFLPQSYGPNLHLPTSPFIQTAPVEAEPATSSIYTVSMDVSGVNSDLKRTPHRVSNSISNIGNGEDVRSDFLSRSCGSNLQLPSSIFVDEALGEASELSFKDHFLSQKTPMREEMQHISRSSFEVQGEGLHYNNVNLEGQHTAGYTTSDFMYSTRKPSELSMNALSKVNHLDNEKYSSSSEFLGPEKMLASTFVDIPTYQALQGADKGATQSGGTVEKPGSQFSRKRPLMDSPTIFQNSTSVKLPVLPSSKKRIDYVTDQDDILTTILDGRMAPSSKAGSIPPLSSRTGSIPPLSSVTCSIPPLSSVTSSIPPISSITGSVPRPFSKPDPIPSLSKQSSQKRPRIMSRGVLPRKRKVLVDDAMVLHADAIRQQLINTEDIRRMRKKAPCTRPEIWKIYISATEDDVFDHSILTGISVELNSLCNLKYEPQRDPSSLELNSQVKISGDTRSSRVLEFAKEMGDKEMNERLVSTPGIANRNDDPSSITESATVQTHESGPHVDLYHKYQKLPIQPQVGPFRNEQVSLTGSSRSSEFLNDMCDKDKNKNISSHITSRNDGPPKITSSSTLQTHEADVHHDMYDQVQKLPVHSPAFSNKHVSEMGSSTVLEFLNEMSDKEINKRIPSVQRNDGPASMNGSVKVQTREVGASQYNQYDQLQKLSVPNELGPFREDQASVMGYSRALEFLNNVGDKEGKGRISSVHSTSRNYGSSSMDASVTLQTHEVGGHHDLYDQVQKLPIHSSPGPFNNNQASVIGPSTVLEFLNEMGEKEINERILSAHGNDGLQSKNESAMVQNREVGAQYNLYDQLQKLPVEPQVELFRNDQTSVIGSSRALEFVVNDIGDKERSEGISSIQSTNSNDGSPTMNELTRLQTQEVGVQYNLHDQLQRLPVQPQVGSLSKASVISSVHSEAETRTISVIQGTPTPGNDKIVQPQDGPFANDQVPVICTMHPNAETHPISIIQETPIRRCVSSDENVTDMSINLPEGCTPLVKAPGRTGSSSILDCPNEMSGRELNERMLFVSNVANKYDGSSSITTSTSVQSNGGDAQFDLPDHLNKLSTELEVGPFGENCVTQPDAEIQNNSIILENPLPEIDKSFFSVEKLIDKSISPTERLLHGDVQRPLSTPVNGSTFAECATFIKIDGDITVECLTSKSLIQTIDTCNSVAAVNNKEEKTWNEADAEHSQSICAMLVDRGKELVVEEAHGSSVVVVTDRAVEASGDGERPLRDVTCAEQNRDDGGLFLGDGERLVSDVTYAEQDRDDGRPVSEITCAEQSVALLSSSVSHAPSKVDENNGMTDFRLERGMDVDSMPLDIHAARDSSDGCSAIDDNYTVSHLPGFLNEDDEAVVNEDGDDVPNPEDAKSLENSGWSARTRGVARYLKNLFDEESGQGRKSVAVNRLLVGKSRKEASRMFFETLVLKTRDYIQVEQEKPYEHINITPRIKLMKSEF